MAGLFITAEPQIFGINTDDDSNTADESTSARILWPLCFALGFLPIGLMNVICEKELKGGEVCIIYFHLLIHTYITWLKHITQILKYFFFIGKIIQLYHVVPICPNHLHGVFILDRFYSRIWNGMCLFLF